MNLKTFFFLVLTVDHYFGAKILFKNIYIYIINKHPGKIVCTFPKKFSIIK